jgi:FtsH-binding integral membrane protein
MSQPASESGAGPPSWRRAVRDVLLVATVVVGTVLGAAAVTSVLPVELQRMVFHTPLAIVVLLVGTAWILWRIAGRRPPEA